MTGSVEVRIIFLQSKTDKTPRRRLQSGCVFNFQEREKYQPNIRRKDRRMAHKKDHDYGTGIPRFEMEALARILLPEIQRFYESAEGQAVLKNGRLNKTPKTPKTTKTSTGGARIAGYGPVGFYEYSSSFSYKKKNPNASPTWKIQFGLSLFEL